jgi:hypothetical protein
MVLRRLDACYRETHYSLSPHYLLSPHPSGSVSIHRAPLENCGSIDTIWCVGIAIWRNSKSRYAASIQYPLTGCHAATRIWSQQLFAGGYLCIHKCHIHPAKGPSFEKLFRLSGWVTSIWQHLRIHKRHIHPAKGPPFAKLFHTSGFVAPIR